MLQVNMHGDKESKTQMYKMNKATRDITVQLEWMYDDTTMDGDTTPK